MRKLLTVLIGFLFTLDLSGYVLTKNNYGHSVKWQKRGNKISLYSSLSSTSNQILNAAVTQWNSTSKLGIELKGASTNDSNKWAGNDKNDIGYSKNTNYFDNTCAVLGVTTLVHDNDGQIREADILLNGFSGCFSNDLGNSNYLGNVITHEMGHLIGLAHNEVIHSTMYYKSSIGQSILSEDDQAGAYTLYPNSNRGGIKGKIVGGNSLVGIFGANVMLISIKRGKVLAASLSNPDGSFTITGVNIDANDRYYIYVSPLGNKDVLPEYYYNIRNNFCHSNTSYRGSFFQSCGQSQAGYPYGVSIGNINQVVDIGNVTIRCNQDVPENYFQYKNDDASILDIVDDRGKIGDTFVGTFEYKYHYDGETVSYIDLGDSDKFKIDLSGIDFSFLAESDESVYLEYRILTQDIFSKLIAKVKINGTDYGIFSTNNDYTLNYNLVGRVSLSKTNFQSNVFEFVIEPQNRWGKCADGLVLDTSSLCPVNGYQEDQIYYMDDNMYDSLYTYMIDFHISKKKNTMANLAENYTIISTKEYDYNRGNDDCPDGPDSYAVNAYIPELFSGLLDGKKTDSDPMACATVEMKNGNGNGPTSNLLSVSLGFVLVWAFGRQKRIKDC